jgi:ring-1,2-phenylacetyl-CoA epoxidase subunit PaaC
MDENERELVTMGIAVDPEPVGKKWNEKISDVFKAAQIPVPADNAFITGSINGNHSEHLGHLLAEMQILPRSMPGAEW